MKGIEHALLSQLDKTNLENLLTQDDLLRTLNESKSTAETVSAQLKNIQVATELLSRVRAVYLPIAQRASCLYFVLQDMQKINSMYQFSMLQFKDIFTRSLELSNVARVEHPHSKDEEEHYASLKTKKMMTIPDRIDLLIQAITQETYRRISYSIYQEDRKLVLYLMAIRIMQFEDNLETNLFEFLITGPKKLSYETQLPFEKGLTQATWVNKVNWAYLAELARTLPFTKENLLQHISSNKNHWYKFVSTNSQKICFDDLPNKNLLDFTFYLDPGQQLRQQTTE